MLTGKIYHPEDKHPDEWQRDLNPDASKGQRFRPRGAAPREGQSPHGLRPSRTSTADSGISTTTS